jgi:LuxR family maltose regulon positive regulatory protein
MPVSLLSTKLHAPPPRPNLVRRPRLIRRLDEGLRQGHRLTLISAPAGFGKTTLLSEWTTHFASSILDFGLHEHRQDPIQNCVSWVSLDRGDNDPARFWSYVVAALARAHRGESAGEGRDEVGSGTMELLHWPQPPPIDSLLAPLLNEITATSSQSVLVLDDYHIIQAQPIHEAVVYLLDHLPPNMHLIIAGRADPPLPLPRFRVREQMTELREIDLRFTAQEAADFLNRAMGLSLSDQDIAALEARTEGWIAGLQLAAIALRSRFPARAPLSRQGGEAVARFVRDFSGSHRYVLDYLVQEVLQQQPPELQEFLVQTAVLERLSAPLCNAVTGRDDSEALLSQLEQANLFLIPLDDVRAWYRYHHLFAEFLGQYLRRTYPGLVSTLHRRASEWYEHEAASPGGNGLAAAAVDHTMVVAAIDHALAAAASDHTLAAATSDHTLAAGAFDQAARLIEGNAEAALMRSEIATFLDWVEALPDDLVRARPSLCLFHAWAMLLTGRPADAVHARLDSADQGPGSTADKAAILRGFIAAFQGQVSHVYQRSDQVLDQLSEDDAFSRSIAAWNLGFSHLWHGDFAAASRALEQAIRMGRSTGNVMIAVVAACHLAEIRMMQGHLAEARALYEQAQGWAIDEEGRRLPIAGMALIGLGELLREADDLGAASRYLCEGIELTKQWGEIGTLDGYISLARIRQAQGDVRGAEEALRQARELAARFDLTEIDDRFVQMHQVRLWIVRGGSDGDRLELAEQWAEARGLRADVTATDLEEQEFSLYYLDEMEYLTFVRWLCARDRCKEALAVLAQLQPAAERQGRTGALIEIEILRAVALQASGELSRAMVALEQALALAGPEGYIHIFADEGEQVARLLRKAAAQGIAPEYVGRLLAACKATPDPKEGESATPAPLVEPLGERELEILRLIAAGLSNREIAQELVVAVSTVKWHINNAYGKLGVHSRTQAVARARDLDLV